MDRSITITWDESDGDPVLYNVYVNGVLDGSLDMALLRNTPENNTDINLFYDETESGYRSNLMLEIQTAYTAYDLNGGTEYTLEVEAEDADGNKSPKSTAVSSTTEPTMDNRIVLFPSYDTYIVGADQNLDAEPQTDYSKSYSLYTRDKVGFDGWHQLYRAYMQFDISELDKPDDIISAQLRVYYISTSVPSPMQNFYEVSDDIPFFSNKNPMNDIGADIEGNPSKDFLLVQDTIDKYDPVFTFQPMGYERPDGVEKWTDGWGWGVIDVTDYIKAAAASTDDDLATLTWVPDAISNNTRLRIVSSDAPMYKPELIIETVAPLSSTKPNLTKNIAIFPNPVAKGENINLVIGQTGRFNMEITNVTGQLIEKRQIESNDARDAVVLDNLNLVKGIYFAKVQGAQFNKSFKFVVK